jgi:hypothetical protein
LIWVNCSIAENQNQQHVMKLKTSHRNIILAIPAAVALVAAAIFFATPSPTASQVTTVVPAKAVVTTDQARQGPDQAQQPQVSNIAGVRVQFKIRGSFAGN